jgi:ADP-ribose pyrophosphatase
MTVYEDSVSKEDDASNKVGMFNRIEVRDAVIVVPLYKDGSFLMVDTYRHGIGRDLLELPGGFINENEAAIDAAKRELIEETGYTSHTLKLINWFYTWPGRTGQKVFVIVADGLKEHSSENLDEFESTKVCRLSASNIRQELKEGRIRSAITISALLAAYFHNQHSKIDTDTNKSNQQAISPRRLIALVTPIIPAVPASQTMEFLTQATPTMTTNIVQEPRVVHPNSDAIASRIRARIPTTFFIFVHYVLNY